MKKIMLGLVVTVILLGCSYSSSYLAGRPMSQDQYQIIKNSIDDGTIHQGMTYDEVYNLLGRAQIRIMNVWIYDTGVVNYALGRSDYGEKFQFNFRKGKLNSIHYSAPGIFGWRNVLKEHQPKSED